MVDGREESKLLHQRLFQPGFAASRRLDRDGSRSSSISRRENDAHAAASEPSAEGETAIAEGFALRPVDIVDIQPRDVFQQRDKGRVVSELVLHDASSKPSSIIIRRSLSLTA